MKIKNLLFILILMPLLLPAKTLTQSELKTLGVRAFKQKAQNLCPEAAHYNLKDCEFLTSGGVIDMAVLHFESGFLIMSAEDAVMPVLAYDFENSIDIGNLAPGLEVLLAQYREEIAIVRRQQLPPSEKIRAAWAELRQPSTRGTRASAVVGPLIQSRWNQNRYYNYLCPQDENAPSGYDGRVPNGCVAVAMSQIIFYYRFPESGFGSHTNYTEYGSFHVNFGQQHYNYDAMCDELNYFNNEVAKLIFHCGTAVNMMYGADGSGAYSGDVPNAMSTYFRYSPTAHQIIKHNYSDSTWHVMLKNELDALRPVYYSGYSTEGGHAFICDGYNTDDYFHFNFGWGGNGNGYFVTESIDESEDAVGGYSYGQSAIVELYPIESNYPTYCNNRVITAIEGTLEDGSGNYPYQNNAYCTYIITDSRQYGVQINIGKMDTQEGHDLLRFWNGHPSQNNLLREFSGTTTEEFSVDADSLYITFETDDSVTAQGWRLSFQSLREQISCGVVESTAPSGTLSDNSGDDHYRDNASCIWNLRNTSNAYYLITFEEMDLSLEDHVDIYDMSLYPVELLGSFTGNTIPDPFICNSNRLRIKFISDNYLNAQGFKLKWEVLGTDIDELGTTAPPYPNPASDLLYLPLPDDMEHCNVTIYNMVGSSVYSQPFTTGGTLEILVRNLPNGIYLLRAESDGKTMHKKIVVKH